MVKYLFILISFIAVNLYGQQEQITYNDKSNPVPIVDRERQATAEDFNDIKSVVNNNADNVDDKFKQVAINLVAKTDYEQANLHTATGAIPRNTQLKASDGTVILDAFIRVNQSTGVTTLNVGANYNNAIFISVGW